LPDSVLSAGGKIASEIVSSYIEAGKDEFEKEEPK